MTNFEKCKWPGCRQESNGTYFNRPVCDYHWVKFLSSEDDRKAETARKTFGLPAKLPVFGAVSKRVIRFRVIKVTKSDPIEEHINHAKDTRISYCW